MVDSAGYASTGVVAALVGRSEGNLQGLLRRHPSLVPQTRVAGRRLWSAADIGRLQAALAAGVGASRRSRGGQ